MNNITAGIYQNVLSEIKEEKATVVSIGRRRVFRWTAAAVVTLIIGTGGYFALRIKTADQPQINVVRNDVKAPQSNRATIALANGARVFLDSAANGQLALEGNTKLVKLADGQVAYQAGLPLAPGPLPTSPNRGGGQNIIRTRLCE